MSQRELAGHLRVSVGKVNYCLRALIEKGWVKAKNFTNSNRKFAYVYLLTPKGVEAKAKVTYRFLRGKLRDYDELATEIETLRAEVSAYRGSQKKSG